ncbi:Dps family protein [Candidatus Synchoanobacter obligatus]|uniref:DNA starvation/stationary phase protection protein n=1 Tax=Candidatus Synchoanobacter obligatus TaxID=2919597 RepID=A0ABT1L734_9GAMM|nr:DNA starvation/stationary phase protection protein [Candidatus Synchoanobacter obligatus]MCP8352198.1 DNA starvation/stationary phase protection protein [Candidatus Synchoanobacter obligatus]
MALSNSLSSVEALKHVLADSYVLLVKVQNVHWNVEGQTFIAIHKLLDELYEDLGESIDVIAERIRALGENSPAAMSEFVALSRLEEFTSSQKDIRQGVEALVHDYEQMSYLMLEHIEVLEKDNDAGTIDLLTDRIRAVDHFAWLLRSNLD